MPILPWLIQTTGNRQGVNANLNTMEKNYIQVTIAVSAESRDILIALLWGIGYENFEETEAGLLAYILESDFNPMVLQEVLDGQHIPTPFSMLRIEQQNWNSVWESAYDPIYIDDFVKIIAPFHVDTPEHFEYTLHIEPKMSFGTGHHFTTRLMIRCMREIDMKGKKVLDMGCGTGILGVLAAKMGAAYVAGIDIDLWSFENAKENIYRNGISNMEIHIGDVSAIPSMTYDVILANINLNVLLEDIPHYTTHFAADGILVCSGYNIGDQEKISAIAQQCGLFLSSTLEDDQWKAGIFKKY